MLNKDLAKKNLRASYGSYLQSSNKNDDVMTVAEYCSTEWEQYSETFDQFFKKHFSSLDEDEKHEAISQVGDFLNEIDS